jgi:hypothetical protein
MIWFAFAGTLILATAPMWLLWAFGFTPTVEVLLQLVICGGPLTR